MFNKSISNNLKCAYIFKLSRYSSALNDHWWDKAFGCTPLCFFIVSFFLLGLNNTHTHTHENGSHKHTPTPTPGMIYFYLVQPIFLALVHARDLREHAKFIHMLASALNEHTHTHIISPREHVQKITEGNKFSMSQKFKLGKMLISD